MLVFITKQPIASTPLCNMINEKYWNIKPNNSKAIMLARRQLSEFVCDAVNLEGINFTLPEIQTLLDGVTVGGHKLSDQQIAVNQSEAWLLLFGWLDRGAFDLSIKKICMLHAVAAKDEALEWGQFRSGGVTIAGTRYMPPSASDLPGIFKDMAKETLCIDDIYDRAIFVFLSMARNQFFYDVNKRMGRFVTNAILLSSGFPAINLPAKRQLEFNQLMLDFYDSGEQQAMNSFLRSCLDMRVIEIMREV